MGKEVRQEKSRSQKAKGCESEGEVRSVSISINIKSFGKLLLATRLLCREPSESVLLLFLVVSEHICAAAVSVIQTTGANTVCHYRPWGMLLTTRWRYRPCGANTACHI